MLQIFIVDFISCSTCLGAPLCPSSGAREYYTVLCVWFSGCCAAARKPDTQPSAPHHTDNLKIKAPNTTGSNQLYNTLEHLMMGIMVPETCWASNKICSKKTSVASSWHLISTYHFLMLHYRALCSSLCCLHQTNTQCVTFHTPNHTVWLILQRVSTLVGAVFRECFRNCVSLVKPW